MFRLTPTDQTWGRQKATVLRDVSDHPWIKYVCSGVLTWNRSDKSYYVRLQKFHGFYSPCVHLEPVPDIVIENWVGDYESCAPILTHYGKVGMGDVKPYKNYFGCTPLLSSMLEAIKGYRKFKVTNGHIAVSQGNENMNPLICAMRESGLKECSMYFDRDRKYWIQTGELPYMRYKADRKLSAWLDSYYKGQTPSPITVIFSDAAISNATSWAAISS